MSQLDLTKRPTSASLPPKRKGAIIIDSRTAADNRQGYQAKQIAEARERAELRRAQRDMKYGSDSEKAAALEYLKQYKAKQEAAQNTAS